MAKSALLKSSLAKKYWMAATGLFLCTFIIAHLSGNLQILIPGWAGKLQFNQYAVFMTTFAPIKVLAYLTYASIIFHTIDGILLTLKNKEARPVAYAYERPEANSKWASRNMGILGTIVLVFIASHMSDFYYQYKFGEVPYMMSENGMYPILKTGEEAAGATINAEGMVEQNGKIIGPAMKDLHGEVIESFKQPILVIFYVLSMLALAFHLSHGFKSAFQSLGINHKKYNGIIQGLGYFVAIGVPIGFALIPIVVYLNN